MVELISEEEEREDCSVCSSNELRSTVIEVAIRFVSSIFDRIEFNFDER